MEGAPGLVVYALASLLAVAMVSGAALRAWRGWIELRRAQLLLGNGSGGIDIPSLRARLKRLEAIANGFDG